MRSIKGHRYSLRYHPFPTEKKKREFIIAEAFLRNEMVSEEDLATLTSVQCDPPDLTVAVKNEKLKIEVTESVPYSREYICHSARFIKDLWSHLRKLGTYPPKPSNIFISTEIQPNGLMFPKIKRKKDIQRIAAKIDSFFRDRDFRSKYSIVKDLVKSPITVTYIPAQGAFASPKRCYYNNLLIRDITGIPIINKKTEGVIKHVITKKAARSGTADILIIFHGIIGMLSFDKILDQMKAKLLSDLTYKGIYVLQIIELPDNQYWTSVTTVQEHPIFQRETKIREILG